MMKDKSLKEICKTIEEHLEDNNHSNCDVGHSYSEMHFYNKDDIKGVAHSIGVII